MITRRLFLGGLLSSACPMPNFPRFQDNDTLDEALTMLAPYGASYSRGLSNHGPMTAEALVALGRADAVVGWVEEYRKGLDERPAKRERIEAAKWRAALGDPTRVRDWDNWFAKELAEAPWREVVGTWVPRLAPGMAAAGLHSVIRVGHAVCSLEVQESAARIDELGRALGYWAAYYLTLPGEPLGGGTLKPSDAFAKVELLPGDQRTSRGLITTELGDLVGFEPFTKAIDLVDPKAGKPSFLQDLLAASAGNFVNTSRGSFEFLHAVTGAASVAELLPYVAEEQRNQVLAYTWQVSAGLFARFAQRGLVPTVSAEITVPVVEELTARAVASGDEHTIKLAAACKREWARNPDPRFLAAAAKRVARHG